MSNFNISLTINEEMRCFVQLAMKLVEIAFICRAIYRETMPNEEVKVLVYRNNLGEGEGTPLQYPCLENPMDGEAWWAAVYGVAQSRTRLK